MKKSRQQKHKEARKRQGKTTGKKPQPRQQPSRLKSILGRLHPRYWLRRSLLWGWKSIAALSAILSLLAAIVGFWPRVSVSSSESLNPRTPFGTPFIVSNDGYTKLTDVSTQMLVRRVVVAVGRNIVVQDNKLFDSHAVPIPALTSGEKYTVTYPVLMSEETPVTRVDVDITVTFRFWILSFEQTKTYKFTTEMAADKTLHWFPRAESE